MADSEDTIFNIPHNIRTVCYMMDARTHQSKGLLYRSSKLDYLMSQDIQNLKNVLGIKSIIDLRSKEEYTHSHDYKFVDECFTLINIRVPETLKRLQAGEKVETEVLQENRSCVEKHYLINIFTRPYMRTVFGRAPWYVRLYCIFWRLIDKVLRSGNLYFMQCFARCIWSKRGLIGTYKDAVELSQSSIYSALKLLTDPDNIPAILSCDYGKDRTGIITALVLSCMGRTVHDICMDYTISKMELEPIKDRMYDDLVKRNHWDVSFLSAKYETMLELLAYILDKYGSVGNYLESIGFGQEDQIQLYLNLGGGEVQFDSHLKVISGNQ